MLSEARFVSPPFDTELARRVRKGKEGRQNQAASIAIFFVIVRNHTIEFRGRTRNDSTELNRGDTTVIFNVIIMTVVKEL